MPLLPPLDSHLRGNDWGVDGQEVLLEDEPAVGYDQVALDGFLAPKDVRRNLRRQGFVRLRFELHATLPLACSRGRNLSDCRGLNRGMEGA